MAIPASFIQDLLNRVDIVDVIDRSVPLKKTGANYSACCPFHNEKSPSFTVSPTKQFYHCFGCGAHGSAIGFVMEYQGLGFVEAVHELAKSAGMTVPEETRVRDQAAEQAAVGMHEALQRALSYYRGQLKQAPAAIEYLKGRGLSGEIAARFQIGYAPGGWQNLKEVFDDYQAEALKAVGLVISNDQGRRYDRFRERVMFPIHDQRGQVIGFGGRVLGSHDESTGPKYLNSPETPLFQKGHELYGLFLARRAIREAGRALVVEGYMDVVALAQHGVEYAVATLGTATTPQHISKLMRQTDNIVFCFDGDTAGRNAAWRAAMNSLPALTDGLKLSFLFLPPEHDPDTYIRAHGKAGFEAALAEALPLSQYLMQTLASRHDMKSQEERVRFLSEAEPILKQIQAPALQLMLRKRCAELADIAPAELDSLMQLAPPKPRRAAAPARGARTIPSLHRRLIHMLLLQPMLANQLPARLIGGHAQEDICLRELIAYAQARERLPSAALLEMFQRSYPQEFTRPIIEAVMQQEASDAEQEFPGALSQLKGQFAQQSLTEVLKIAQERGLQALDAEQKALLQQFRRGTVKDSD